MILQDPAYGDNEIDFIVNSGPLGGVQITNDPEGFSLIDEKTIFFNIGGYSAFWYRIQNGPPPAAIITDILETKTEGGGANNETTGRLTQKVHSSGNSPKGY